MTVPAALALEPSSAVCRIEKRESCGTPRLILLFVLFVCFFLCQVYPLDLALGFLLPLHMQLGMSDIIRDYVPNNTQLVQWAMYIITFCTALGLTKLNFNGEGITAGAKRLWKSSVTSKKD